MNPQSSLSDSSRPAPLAAFRSRHRDSLGFCAHRWSLGPGDGAPDGLTPEDFHDMARVLESMARAIRQEADRKWAERKRIGEREKDSLPREPDRVPEVKRIVIDKASYERGRSDGEDGRRSSVPVGIDEFSYYSGYIEGKADRERTKCPHSVPANCMKERE